MPTTPRSKEAQPNTAGYKLLWVSVKLLGSILALLGVVATSNRLAPEFLASVLGGHYLICTTVILGVCCVMWVLLHEEITALRTSLQEVRGSESRLHGRLHEADKIGERNRALQAKLSAAGETEQEKQSLPLELEEGIVSELDALDVGSQPSKPR